MFQTNIRAATQLFRAFFWLETHLARQYRWAMVSQLTQFFVFLLIFSRLPIEKSVFGGLPYIQYVLTGIVYQIFYEAIMNGPTSRLSELQMTGQLQLVLSAPYPRWMVLFASGATSAIAGIFRAGVVLVAGSLIFGVSLHVYSLMPLVLSIVFTAALCTSLALLNVAGSLLWPRLNLTSFFSSLLLGLLSGVFIPIDRLPTICRWIAEVNPLRWGLEAFRFSFGEEPGHPGIDQTRALIVCILFIAVVATLSLLAYRRADRALTRDNRYQYF